MNKAIEYAEENFRCLMGEQKAFFEIPQRNGEPIRGIYVVYALRGRDEEALERAMVASFRKLKEMGGEYLYWRNEEKVSLGQDGDGLHRIRARIVVFDRDLRPIVWDDAVKIEGEATKELAA